MPYPKTIPSPPKGFDFTRVAELKEALQVMDPLELGLAGTPKPSLRTKNYYWQSLDQLKEYVTDLTGQEEIKYADYVLSQWQESFTEVPVYEAASMTPQPESPAEATISKLQLEELAEAQIKEQERLQKLKTVHEDVQKTIDRKKELIEQQKIITQEQQESVTQKAAEQKETEVSEVDQVEQSVPEPATYSPTISPQPIYETEEQEVQQKEPEFPPEEEIRRKADARAVIENIRAQVRAEKAEFDEEILKAQELKEQVSGTKVYVKVVQPEQELTAIAQTLKTQALADPKRFVEDTASTFQKNLAGQNLTNEEASLIAHEAALDTYSTLAGNPPLLQATVVAKVVTSPELLNKFSEKPSVQTDVQNVGLHLVSMRMSQYELYKQFVKANKLENVEPNNIRVIVSATPQDGYEEFDIHEKIIVPHTESLQNQSSILAHLQNVDDLSPVNIKAQVLRKAGESLANKIATLPEESLLARTYNSNLVQFGLSQVGLTAPLEYVAIEGSWLGNFLVSSGYGPFAGFIQESTGINLGIIKLATSVEGGIETAGGTLLRDAALTIGSGATGTAIAAAAAGYATTATTIAATGGVMASEAFLGGAGAAMAAGAAAGTTVAPVVGTIIGAAAGLVTAAIPKLKRFFEDFLRKYAIPFVGAIGGLMGGLIGAASGFGLVGGALAGATLGGGAAAFFSGGLAGLTSAISALWSSFTAAIAGALGLVFAGLGAPLLAFLIGFPLLVAFIMLVINSGAYLVPPSLSSIASQNIYMDVQKVANPSGTLNSPQPITYTITVTAKNNNLTRISFASECHAIKKGSSGQSGCPPEQIPAPPTEILPGTPFSFQYTVNFGSNYQDSLVANTFTVSAFANEGGFVTTTASASVCFGDCPLNCFGFPDQFWPQGNSDVQTLKSLLINAGGVLEASYPNFSRKVCSAGAVNLCYNPGAVPGADIYAYHEHSGTCDIDFNSNVLSGGQEGVLYLLTHEATHHIQNIPGGGGYIQKYQDRVSPIPICTYGGADPYESMGEAAALFVARPVIMANGDCITNFASQYPRHYDFARSCLFAASCP